MIVSDKSSFFRVLQWQQQHIVRFLLLGCAAYTIVEVFGLTFLRLPLLPVSIIGASLGIFVSFRANSSYDRWWEGRKLWGRMINMSRHFASQVIACLPKECGTEMVYRHIHYVHVLRVSLRGEAVQDDKEIRRTAARLSDELQISTNPAFDGLQKQMNELIAARGDTDLDGFAFQQIEDTLRELIHIQGGCERIQKTPLPISYRYFSEAIIYIFAALCPFALLDGLGVLAIPISALLSFCFHLISETGRVLENPFSTFWNGLPLNQISIMIEQNLLQALQEDDLPPTVEPFAPGVLM